MDPVQLPHELRATVERELAAGERIRWCAQPNPRRLTLLTLPLVLFAIPWTAFSVFWMWGASGFGKAPKGLGIAFSLFGIPFVLIGLGMLSAPFWARRKARRTAYVITDRRAILFEGGWSLKVESFPHGQVQSIYRRERRDGSGDLVFRRNQWRDIDGGHRTAETGFVGIPNVREVETLLQSLAPPPPR